MDGQTTHALLSFVLSCHVMSCHVMSRHVTSRHVMSRHVMSLHVTSCHVMSRHATSCHVTSCNIMSRHVTSRHVMPRHVTPCHVMSRPVTLYHTMSRHMSRPAMSRHVTLCQVMSYHVMPRCVTSCHVTSCHVLSRTVTPCHVGCPEGCRFLTASAVYHLVFLVWWQWNLYSAGSVGCISYNMHLLMHLCSLLVHLCSLLMHLCSLLVRHCWWHLNWRLCNAICLLSDFEFLHGVIWVIMLPTPTLDTVSVVLFRVSRVSRWKLMTTGVAWSHESCTEEWFINRVGFAFLLITRDIYNAKNFWNFSIFIIAPGMTLVYHYRPFSTIMASCFPTA